MLNCKVQSSGFYQPALFKFYRVMYKSIAKFSSFTLWKGYLIILFLFHLCQKRLKTILPRGLFRLFGNNQTWTCATPLIVSGNKKDCIYLSVNLPLSLSVLFDIIMKMLSILRLWCDNVAKQKCGPLYFDFIWIINY